MFLVVQFFSLHYFQGAGVAFNMESVFHDKKFWGDPEVFRPERFLQKSKEGSALEYDLVNTERIAVFGFGKYAV